MTKGLKALVENINKELGGKFIQPCELNNELIVIRVIPKNLSKTIQFLRDSNQCMFKQLVDIFAVDYPENEDRFEVNYNLLSFKHNARCVVKVCVDEATPLDSVASLYSAAVWYEREVWDMNGVKFEGNPDLRRILTDYGFEGHPLRKDFPLTGYKEVHYDESQQRVVYDKVNLQQEFRNFDFVSPWEGTEYVLPGDEKATKEE